MIVLLQSLNLCVSTVLNNQIFYCYCFDNKFHDLANLAVYMGILKQHCFVTSTVMSTIFY